MSSPDTGSVLFYILLLVLPLSSLVARRLPIGQVARMVAAWVGIFGGLMLVVALGTRAGITPSTIGDALGLSEQTVSGRTVRIAKAADGHFWTTVTIGTVSRRMLIDSGATTTAISPETARVAGIDAAADPFGTIIKTANGLVIARRATAPRLAVGPIEARNIEVLVGGNFDDGEVIGMNFLSSLKSWRVEGDSMILEPRA